MSTNLNKGVRALMKLSDVSTDQIAKELNLNKQSLYNKLARGTYSAGFFLQLVNLLGGTVVIEYDNHRIEFREDGVFLRSPEKSL